ncbi:MAG: WD40/YVTN/BNR-like repeat-containing protein [Alphaproteobacteria bacterium]
MGNVAASRLVLAAGLWLGPLLGVEALAAPAGFAVSDEAGLARPSPLAPKRLLTAIARAGTRLVAVGDHGHVVLSDDFGRTWRQATRVPARVLLTSVTFVDGRTGWAGGHDAVILKTVDGGETWTRQYADPDAEAPVLALHFRNGSHGLAVGAFALALETVDGGNLWEPRALTLAEGTEPEHDGAVPRDGHLNAVLPLGDGRRLIPAEFGQVFRGPGPDARPVSGGLGFNRANVGYDGSLWGGLVTTTGTVLVFGMRGTIRRSSDGGQSWVPIPAGTRKSLTGGTVLPDGSIILVGLGGTLAISRNDGIGFQAIQRADRKDLTAAAPSGDGGLVVTGDAGVLRLDPSRDLAFGGR